MSIRGIYHSTELVHRGSMEERLHNQSISNLDMHENYYQSYHLFAAIQPNLLTTHSKNCLRCIIMNARSTILSCHIPAYRYSRSIQVVICAPILMVPDEGDAY